MTVTDPKPCLHCGAILPAHNPGCWVANGFVESKEPQQPKQESLDEIFESESLRGKTILKAAILDWHAQKLRELRDIVAERVRSCPEEDFVKTDAIVYLNSAIDRALKETE